MQKTSIFYPFIVLIVLSSNIEMFAHPELIASDALLPHNEVGGLCIAIGTAQDSIIRAIWIQYTPEWDFYLHLGKRDPAGYWDSKQVPVNNFGGASLFLGNDGRAFISTGNNELVIENGDDFVVRDIYPNTVMDSTGSFHSIQGENGFFIYSLSNDTLQSYSYYDTLLFDYDLLTIEASADRGKICAVFSNGDTLAKFTGSAGVPLTFDSSAVYPAGDDYNGYSRADLGLDKSERIFIPYIGEGQGEYWASIHIWSQGCGDRFIWNADDPALNVYRFEACFAEKDTVFVLGSTELNNASYILFSTDGGVIWNYSYLAPRGAICTSPRLAGENLHLISDDLGSGDIYYESF